MPLMPINTETAVGNEALSLLRQPSINNIETGQTHPEKVLRLHFAPTRDALLRKYPWNFAECEATLTADSELSSVRFRYGYVLPVDPHCLHVREIWQARDCKWRIAGRVLWTNIGPSCTIIYTGRIVEVGQWDALFRSAFATALAGRVAPEIAKDLELEVEKQRQAEVALAAAFPPDLSEGIPEEPQEPDIIRARW